MEVDEFQHVLEYPGVPNDGLIVALACAQLPTPVLLPAGYCRPRYGCRTVVLLQYYRVSMDRLVGPGLTHPPCSPRKRLIAAKLGMDQALKLSSSSIFERGNFEYELFQVQLSSNNMILNTRVFILRRLYGLQGV